MTELKLNLNLVGTEELVDELLRRSPNVCLALTLSQGPGQPDRLIFRWSSNSYQASAMAASMSRQIDKQLDAALQSTSPSAAAPAAAPAPVINWSGPITPFRAPNPPEAPSQG